MTISTIRRFNTHDTPDDAIIALQTGRDNERQHVLDTIQGNLNPKQRQLQHILIKAPRGFGKSYMARLAEIDSHGLAESGATISFALLPEEQRNVSSPASLLKEIRRIVTDERWDSVTSMWDDDEDAWKDAVADLDEALDDLFGDDDGLLVVAIENLDSLFRDVFKTDPDQLALRKWMTRKNNRIMVLATATGSVDLDYSKPIFKAFEEIDLQPWTEDNCIEYFNQLREFKEDKLLDDEQIAKARAISTFIGGNPRLARFLGHVIATENVMTVAETLDGLVDDLSDYYRRRIDDLTGKTKTLLDALIRGGEPCSQSELAERVGTEQSRIARAFAELKRNQIVVGKKVTGGRETLYHVTDRVFVHFYRTRYGGVVREDSPLVGITELLKTFFTTDEKRDQACAFLDSGLLKEGRLMADLARDESGLANIAFPFGFFEYQPKYFSSYLDFILKVDTSPIVKLESDKLLQTVSCLIDSPEGCFHQSQLALKNSSSVEMTVLWLVLCGLASASLALNDRAFDYFNQAIEKADDSPELVSISCYCSGVFEIAGLDDFKHGIEKISRAAQYILVSGAGIQAAMFMSELVLVYSENPNVSKLIPPLHTYFDTLFIQAAYAQRWSALVKIWESSKSEFENQINAQSLNSVAFVFISMVEMKRYADAYASVEDLVSNLASEIKGKPSAVLDSKYPEVIVQTTLQALIVSCKETSLLTDIAALIKTTFTNHFEREVLLLEAAAIYHQSNRDPASLERVDPDIASALLKMWKGK